MDRAIHNLWAADAATLRDDRGPRIRLRQNPRPGATPLRLGLYGSIALVTLLVGASLLPPFRGAQAGATAGAAPAAIVPHWIDIPQPLRLFNLSGTPFAKLPLAYEARRRPDGSERQDTLTFGAFSPASRYLRLALARRGSTTPAPADLVVDFARLAATDGLGVIRAGLPSAIPTRFGMFEAAALTLRRDAVTLPCLGFRFAGPGSASPVAIAGLACGAADHPIERGDLACVLDRIDLVSAGEDPPLRDFFVAAERRRGEACRPLRSADAQAQH